jgi:hypothetical protein
MTLEIQSNTVAHDDDFTSTQSTLCRSGNFNPFRKPLSDLTNRNTLSIFSNAQINPFRKVSVFSSSINEEQNKPKINNQLAKVSAEEERILKKKKKDIRRQRKLPNSSLR